MQAEAHQSSKPTQDQAQGELNTQLLGRKQEYWLADEFNRLPYQLYKCLLVLNSIVLLVIEFWIFVRMTNIGDFLLLVGFFLIVYGCVEMLKAIIGQKSKLAQQSLSKFNYGTAILIVVFLLGLCHVKDFTTLLFEGQEDGILIWFIFIFIQILHFFVGTAVIHAFRKNHPLVKQKDPLNLGYGEEGARDLFEQNKIIEDEVLKYDQKLESYLYLAFRCWLKLVVIAEIFQVSCSFIVADNSTFLLFDTRGPRVIEWALRFILPIPSSILTLYSCFQIEDAIQIKSLMKSQRALKVITADIIVSGILYLVHLIHLNNSKVPLSPDYMPFRGEMFLFYLVIPIVTFIGVRSAHQILERRNQIAQLSNYNNDSYL